MLFVSIEFVIFFIVVVSAFFLIKHRKFQILLLLGASYFFFFYSSNYLITLLIASTLLDFFVGKEIYSAVSRRRKKVLLSISIIGNIGLLSFFKYADFGIEQFNNLANYLGVQSDVAFLNLVLPLGISFYTFQTLSYTIDIYRGDLTPSKSFKEFAVFVAFFPTLVIGPIVRAKDFLPQLREKFEGSNVSGNLKLHLFNDRNFKFGISLIALGFFKKMFFADNIAPLVNHVFASPIGEESFTIILATLGFGIQVYSDFSGYSDIAIGAALIFGIKIKQNFDKPFFATSVSDFWRRWHISLSSWVRDYLYQPLVSNRRDSYVVVFFSLVLTMTVIGFWHGADWNFLIFGFIHGVFLGCYRVLTIKLPMLKGTKFFKSKFGKIFSILATQYFIFWTFVVFRSQNLSDMTYSMQKYLIWDFATEKTITLILNFKFEVVLIALFFILHYISYRKGNIPERISNLSIVSWLFLISGIIFVILLFYSGNPEDFFYFRF